MANIIECLINYTNRFVLLVLFNETITYEIESPSQFNIDERVGIVDLGL